MAGAGKKTFQVNEVLSAADVNNYLMDQSVMRFADDTARSSAIGTPSEGMVSYLDDSNQVEVYDGSAWVNFTGDITQVTAGTALTGGGTEGNVTLDVDISAISSAQAGTALTASGEVLNVDDATPTSVGVVKGDTTGLVVYLGDGAGENATTSIGVGVGRDALQNDEAFGNSAFGDNALRENTTGNRNTALGRRSLENNTTGEQNIAIGEDALASNLISNFNLAIGPSALENLTSGDSNISIGIGSSGSLSDGRSNVALGRNALKDQTIADDNTAVGNFSNITTTTGTNVQTFGFRSEPSSATVSNEITLGNDDITSLRCNVQSISSLSDQRDKTNIQDSPLGLDLIQRLRPVTFDWDRRDGSFAGRKDVGFIAQDVVEVEDELDIEDTLRMSYRSNPEKLEVAPARLIPVLTKAIQELSEQNAELKARLDKLEGK